MSQAILNETKVRMTKALEHTLHEFSNIHTGKANPAMVESIQIEAYGSSMRIKDCAAISTPDPRMIVIQPWDKGLIQAISKGIQTANLGFNPSVDGNFVRVPLAVMSRERREEFVKVAHRLAEDGRVQIRTIRRDAHDALKKAALPEDITNRATKEIQTLTDKFTADSNTHVAAKEKELTGT
jgi:ribosome recycling factor